MKITYPDTLTPTWENQLRKARALLHSKGLNALLNPHASTGRICRCHDCFCCAALQVYNEARKGGVP